MAAEISLQLPLFVLGGWDMAERVENLKSRTKRCVCKYCGAKLELKRIIYGDIENARIEIFCSECGRIEYGVEQEIYHAAKYFVEDMGFNAYQDLDYNENTKKMNIAKVCEIIAWGLKNLDLMTVDGFKYPVNINSEIDGETLHIDEDKLEQLLLSSMDKQ